MHACVCVCVYVCVCVCVGVTGLQTSQLYWPGRIGHLAKTVLFNIHLYDAGETALKRYDHILPVSFVVNVSLSIHSLSLYQLLLDSK